MSRSVYETYCTQRRTKPFCFCLGLFLLLLLVSSAAAQTVRSASGAMSADIIPARDQFRVDLGGGTIAGANGSFGGVRREINWDGVPAGFAAPNNLPANFFNVNSPRGVVFSTAGTGFQVSGATTDAGAGQPAAANFGNLNATYTSTFQQFSPQRLFTSLGSNVLDVNFFVAGTSIPAVVSGFGAVFTDVDNTNTTSIQFFDKNNVSLGSFFVPAFGGGFSFLGVTFPAGMEVSRVRINSGNAPVGPNDNPPATDVVVMDDFIYGEPLAIATATDGSVSGTILDSSGNPIAGTAIRLTGTQNRLTITDASGSYHFDNVETNGFYIVTPSRANYTFSPSQRTFSQLGQHIDAAFTASLNSGSIVNPLDTLEFFVRQQYLDFLGREPDEPGFTAWVDGLSNCAAGDVSCDRVHLSEMFFRSGEFQQRGYFLYRFYSTAFGRKPDFAEFGPDLQRVSGFLTDEQLEAAKAKFVEDFITRPLFVSAYGGLNNADYVNALLNTAQVSLANRDDLIVSLNNSTLTRAQALRQIVESNEVSQKYYNQAFVVMEYFGYLRRDPDALYLDWIDVLNLSGEARHMVEGFVNSIEYRNRFQR